MEGSLKPLAGELTAVVNRDIFDAPPAWADTEVDFDRWKLFRERYHARQTFSERYPDRPLQLDLALNTSCQMRCSFCLHGHTAVQRHIMTPETYRRVLAEAQQIGIVSMKLNHINEPLLVKAFPELAAEASTYGILNVYFATNGLLLDEDVAERLVKARVSKVMVSLDATTPETFQLMRHSNRFDEIVANVTRLIEVRNRMKSKYPLVRVNFVRTRINSHEADAFLEKWGTVADAIGFQSQVGVPGFSEKVLQQGDTREPFRCSFPFKQIVVNADGAILPCCTFSGLEMPIGNIATSTLMDAWNSEKAQNLREAHYEGRGTDNPVCRACVNGE